MSHKRGVEDVAPYSTCVSVCTVMLAGRPLLIFVPLFPQYPIRQKSTVFYKNFCYYFTNGKFYYII